MHEIHATDQAAAETQQSCFMTLSTPLYDENEDYIDENHINTFAKALLWEDDDHDGLASPPLPAYEGDKLAEVNAEELSLVLTPEPNNELEKSRPEFVVSHNDWYPINAPEKSKAKADAKGRKKRASTRDEFRSSAAYTLLRWPFLIIITVWILLLCILYTVVRAYVALLEYMLTWVGERKVLRNKLRASKTYEEWIENALELDRYLHLDKWSSIPRFSYYDYRTVKRTTSKLRMLRMRGMDEELMVFLQGCLKKNFAGIENRQLYAHRYYGTKNVVHVYIDEVVASIDHVTESENITPEDKRRFFRSVLRNYGRTALCLSGGACFAYTHFGIVKALLDNDLLPSIITGTSGGGLVAALACTRTDDELKQLLVPRLARKITACEDPWYVWIPRWWRTGARFDSTAWARKSNYFTLGSLTFQEAYHRTGRRLNISTVPADPHSPVILCNNITAPNCIIWLCLLASSAVPGILNPVVLMMKDSKKNTIVPFSLGSKWKDGSLRTDIPIDALKTYYNVNFTVVSQVNPHILLFFFAPKGSVGRPVALSRRKTRREKYASLRGGFIATALEHIFKLEIKKWLEMIKTLDLLPRLLELDWLSIWLQRFTGLITIWPRNNFRDFWYILSDPSEEGLGEMIRKGERYMFPKILFLKHRLSIENAIERGRTKSKLSTAHLEHSPRFSGTPEFAGPEFQLQTVHYDDDYDSESSAEETLLPGFSQGTHAVLTDESDDDSSDDEIDD